MVCGAKATESDYLQGLKSSVRNPAVSLRIVKHPRSPSQVVDHAVFLRGQAEGEYDEVWCVLDVDDFQDLGQAVAEARRKNIEVAFSNPCFELWLLLHFRDYRRQVQSFRELVPDLDRVLPAGYEKAGMKFDHYEPHWRLAVSRAKQLAEPGSEHETNPSTGMWKLALAIGGGEAGS
ncbi:RloB family protein [Kitasatospora sp. NPDC057518]|uniref:RloB family protein n=1 Tax=Kitasatospora sp. NPDC057518 TaxID=3346155 RepID=UPI003695CC1D